MKTSLSPEEQAVLSATLGTVKGAGPLPIVIASNDYAELLDNWLCHLDALGVERRLVVGMDTSIAERLRKVNVPSAQCSFDGTTNDFWLQLILIWDFLSSRVAFVNSDIDALWLRNPVEYFTHTDCDLLFSQGTILPADILEQWGFVLCTGLFYSRPGPGTERFFTKLRSRALQILDTDDQTAINRMLFEAGITWQTSGIGRHDIPFRGFVFTCYDELVIGECQALGCRIGLLPHHLFPRVTDGRAGPYVKHVLRSEDPAERTGLLRAAGCWLLDNRRGRLTS